MDWPFTLTDPEVINLTDIPYNWKIGNDFLGGILLNQKDVAINQSLVGTINFRDNHNNKLLSVEKKSGSINRDYYPS